MGQRSGTTIVQQQPLSVRVDDGGITETVPYESSDWTQLLPLLGLYAGFPYDYQSKFGGGARVDFHLPYSFSQGGSPETYVQPLWEFFASKADKDVLSADLPWGTIGAISPADALLVQTALSIQQQNIPINANWFAAPTDATGSALKNSAGSDVAAAANPSGCYSVFLLMVRGMKDYAVFAPILRFTQTVTSQYAIAASFTNVRRLLSRGTLIVAENIPGALLFNIPFDPAVTQYVETLGDLQYAWFKDFPTVRQIARLKWNIVQEWQYGLWPVKTFGAVL